LTLIEGSDPIEDIIAMLEKSATRFVIMHGDTPDSVLGIIDLHQWKLAERPPWSTVMQAPFFVPETFPALDALNQHLTTAANCLLITDEYGGLEGMVTQEEIVDWLLYDAAPWQGDANELREESGGRFIADGTARVDHIADVMKVNLDAGGIDTIGGLIFNHLGYLPKPGERVRLGGLDVKIRRVSRRRVQQVELRPALPSKPKDKEDAA
jgi:CBS domain containing-hemolysin-like protein